MTFSRFHLAPLLLAALAGCYSFESPPDPSMNGGSSEGGVLAHGGGGGGGNGGIGGQGAPSEPELGCGPDWVAEPLEVWSRSFGDEGDPTADMVQSAHAVVIDENGGAFLAGSYDFPMDLGTGPLPVTVASQLYPRGRFLAHFDVSGVATYVTTFQSDTGASISDVDAAAGSSAAFVLGDFVGSLEPGDLQESGPGGIFVARLDGAGAPVWVEAIGGTEYDVSHALAVDSVADAIYVAGGFNGTLVFGGSTLTAEFSLDYVARVDATTGAQGWITTFGSEVSGCQSSVSALTVDDLGDIYALVPLPANEGCVCSFGTETFTTDTRRGMVLIKIGSNGAVQWARPIYGSQYNYARGLATSNGNVYVWGAFRGELALAEGSVTVGANDNDLYLASFDGEMGDLQFSRRLGGFGSEEGGGMAADALGRLWAVGSASGSQYGVDLGCPEQVVPNETTLTRPFLIGFDPDDGSTLMARFPNASATGNYTFTDIDAAGTRLGIAGQLGQKQGPIELDFGGAPLVMSKSSPDAFGVVLDVP